MRKFFLSFNLCLLMALVPCIGKAAAGDALFGEDKPEIYNPTKEVNRLISRGKLQDALNLADSELEKNPQNLNLRFTRGVIFSDMKKYKEAKEIFEQLIREYPEVAEPYNNLAVIYAAEGNKGRAKELLETSLSNNAKSITTYNNLGDVYLAYALEMFEKASKLAPNNKRISKKVETLRELTN